jgi:hypothetical protein
MFIPFDQPDSVGRYELVLSPLTAELGDGVILAANRDGFRALAEILVQLADSAAEHVHIHLGYNEQEPAGPGFRLVLTPTGRVDDGAA